MSGEKLNNWKEALDQLESVGGSPNEALWNRLDERLQAQHSKRKRYPIRALLAAACLLILFGVVYLRFEGSTVPKPVVQEMIIPVAQRKQQNAEPTKVESGTALLHPSVAVSMAPGIKPIQRELATKPVKELPAIKIINAEPSYISTEHEMAPVAQVPVDFPALKKKMPVVHVNELESRLMPYESASSAGRHPKSKWLGKPSELNAGEAPQSSLSIKFPL